MAGTGKSAVFAPVIQFPSVPKAVQRQSSTRYILALKTTHKA